MAKISTYGIDAAPNLGDKVIGTDVHDNNITKNYTLGDIYDLFASQGGGGTGFVPYTGANNNVDLGAYTLTASEIIKLGGTSSQFLKADGSVDSNNYLTTSNAGTLYVPYTGANNNVDLGMYSLISPNVVTDLISPISTLIYTEYLGNTKGLYLNYDLMGEEMFSLGGDLFSVSNSTSINVINTQNFITAVHNGDSYGLILDYNSDAFILGDGAEINNATYLFVNDNSLGQGIFTFNQGINKGINISFLAEEYSFGDLNKDVLIIDNQYDVIYTQHNGNLIGLELYFPNGEYILGDINGINNGTYLKVDDTNERVEISKALYTSGSEGTVGQILVSQGAGVAPQWQNHASVSSYYGSFYDTTTQTVASGGIAAMKYNTNVINTNGVTITKSGFPTRITMANAGVYNIQFSAQLNRTTGGTDAQIDIWLRKNGVDIPYSATSITMKANAKNVVAAWNFFETVTAGQYLEIAWTQNDAVEIIQYPANLVVPFPAIPSVILTVNKVG